MLYRAYIRAVVLQQKANYCSENFELVEKVVVKVMANETRVFASFCDQHIVCIFLYNSFIRVDVVLLNPCYRT